MQNTLENPIEAFLACCTVEKGLAQNTTDAYRRDLHHLAESLQGVSLTHATREQVQGFLTWLDTRGVSARSRNRAVSTLRMFYRFLDREQALPGQAPTAFLL